MSELQVKISSLVKKVEQVISQLEKYLEVNDGEDARRVAHLTHQTLELCKQYLRGNTHDVSLINRIEILVNDMVANPSHLARDETIVKALLIDLEKEVAELV